MDSASLPIDDLMSDFDAGTLLSSADDSTPMPFKQGMKCLSEDPVTSCTLVDDSPFMPSESVTENATVYQHSIPCTSNETPGNHNFQIELGSQPKRVANPDRVYKNGKLYIKPATLCPVVLSASSTLPPSCNITITPVFKNPAHIREIVRCCPNHTVLDSSTHGFSSVAHFIRCDNEKVKYKECPVTGRYYLVVPFMPTQQDPATKTLKCHELFSFICNNSCGGLNRRAIQVIFEIKQGQNTLGRKLLEVRVCACPGRDSKLEDPQKQAFRRKRKSQTTEEPLYLHIEEPQYQAPVSTRPPEETPARKKKSSGEHFYLKINGRQNYMIMERIAKALELFSSMEKRFFSKNLPLQALEQMTRNSLQNTDPEYVEPDSTLYRRSSHMEMHPSFSETSSSVSPNGIRHWPDSTLHHSHTHQSPSSSQNIPVPYPSHSVRRTSLVN